MVKYRFLFKQKINETLKLNFDWTGEGLKVLPKLLFQHTVKQFFCVGFNQPPSVFVGGTIQSYFLCCFFASNSFALPMLLFLQQKKISCNMLRSHGDYFVPLFRQLAPDYC